MPLGVTVQMNTGPMLDVLNELEARTATVNASTAGARYVSKAVKPAAPKRIGALRTAQGVKGKKGKKGKTKSFALQGARTSYTKTVKRGKFKGAYVYPAKYDHLVIGGVKPHGVGKGGRVVNKKHPGARANPYRERVFRSIMDQVGEVMLERLKVEIEKILDKNAAKLRAKKRMR